MTQDLATTLGQFVIRSGYTSGQLAKLTQIPKATIVNWLEGRVKRPRVVHDLLRLAIALHLTEADTDMLLASANHPPVQALRTTATHDSQLDSLVTHWAVAEVQAESVASLRPPPFQAMVDLPSFVGREIEIAAMSSALTADDTHTLYTLQGMAGVGKTALAVHLAYRLRSQFRDGVLWARVDNTDTMSILATFAHAYDFDVSQYADLQSRSRVVRELLASKRVLIVLDQVQTSQQVKPLLPPTGSCAVLMTTRHHNLSVARRAKRFVLEPFAAEDGTALQLFAHLLGGERVTKERGQFAEIADLLGHLPLAVDIAASRLAYEVGWETAVFLQRMRQQKRRLTELDYEDQSLYLSFETSYTALPAPLQQFFASLSLFEGDDFSDEAAAFVTDSSLEDAQDYLRQLHSLSLVGIGRANGRYRLHPLLKDFAHKRHAQTEDSQRLIAYYTHFVAQHPTVPKLEQALGNLLTAVRHAHQQNDPQVWLLVNGLYRFLEASGLYDVAQTQIEYTEGVPPPSSLAQATCNYHKGRLAERRGQYVQAQHDYQTALEQARTEQDNLLLSALLRRLGVLSARQGDYVLAEAYYKEGLGLARSLGQGSAVSDFLRGLGVQAYMRGDFSHAEAFYEAGLDLLTKGQATDKTVEGQAGMLWGLGVLAEEQGDPQQAQQYYEQALTLTRPLGLLERVVVLLRALGCLMIKQEAFAPAHVYLDEAWKLASQIGHQWLMGRVLSERGALLLAEDAQEMAEQTFKVLYQQARILQSQELIANAEFGLARVYAHSYPEKAMQYARQSLDTYTAIGHQQVAVVQAWLASK